MQKNNYRFKKLKIKIEKREKKREREENSTELQKPNIEAEVYKNNKNVTKGKKSSKA